MGSNPPTIIDVARARLNDKEFQQFLEDVKTAKAYGQMMDQAKEFKFGL